MGNRPFSLPLPTLVGGTSELGDGPLVETAGGPPRAAWDKVEAEDGAAELSYAMAILLQNGQRQTFLSCGENSACKHQREVLSTSLVTFHGRKGEQMNYRGDTDLASVRDGDIVTIYANVTSGGQYLCAVNKQLEWTGTTRLLATKAAPYEFIVRKGRARKSRSYSLMRTFNKFPFKKSITGLRRPSSLRGLEKYHSGDRNSRENFESPASNLQDLSEREDNRESLLVQDRITLESSWKPGQFLSTKNDGSVQLSGSDRTCFTVTLPKLQHLVKLNGDAKGGHMLNPLGGSSSVKRKTQMPESERQWMDLLKRLPLDIVYRILQYKVGWVRLARLVSKDWCAATSRHIHRIRVNGEFADLESPAQCNMLLNLIRKSINLTRLVLRNVDQIEEDDLQDSLKNCKYLRQLSLGGCRALTDKFIVTMDTREKLIDLNVAATGITDQSLQVLHEVAPNLTSLNLYGCRTVSVDAISNAMAALPHLETINIRGCHVSKVQVDALQQEYPDVNILSGPINMDGIY